MKFSTMIDTDDSLCVCITSHGVLFISNLIDCDSYGAFDFYEHTYQRLRLLRLIDYRGDINYHPAWF